MQRGIEQWMDHPLPPAGEGERPGPGEPEVDQARHDMQCVKMMLETVPDHGAPRVGPITGLERVPFGCTRSRRQRAPSAPHASWKKHIPYRLCPVDGEAFTGGV
jgi:hypothetical protein